MQKYVLDTNVLLQNFQSLFAFDTEETIIPLVVLEELDKHKKHEKLGHNARQVARYLDKLSKRGDVTQGVELNNGGILKVVSVSDYTLEALELDVSNDNKIIATAHSEDAILISNDVLVRVKARGLGITAESYDPEEVRNLDTEYRGVVKLDLTFEEESTVTQEGFKMPQSEDKGIFANTYATLRTGLNSSRLVRYDASESMFKPFNVPKSVMGIEPRSTEQKYLLDALLDPSISLVTVKGKSGSGKTLMAIAAALEMVLEKEMYTKIIVTRAVEPMGRDIGYLPGPQPLDAKIVTPYGWTTMGELKVGDFVISRDGTKSRVLNIFPKGKKEVYRITTTDGTSTEACLDHLWETTTFEERKRNKKGQIRTTKEILDTLTRENGKPNHFLPRNNPVEFELSENITIPPYLLGALLGDGSLSSYISLSSADTEIINKARFDVESLGYSLNNVGGINYNISGVEFNKKCSNIVVIENTKTGEVSKFSTPSEAVKVTGLNRSTIQYRCRTGSIVEDLKFSLEDSNISYTNIVKQYIYELGLLGKKAWEKFIPKNYLYSPINVRLELLRGLMDTDGSCKKNGEATFFTTSEQLAKDVMELVRSLGGGTYLRVRNRIGEKSREIDGRKVEPRRICFEVGVSLDESLNPFHLSRKANRYSKKYIHRIGIKSIEKVGDKEVQCILIDHPEHLYLTDDFIVTHNTMEEKLGPWVKPVFDNIEYILGDKPNNNGVYSVEDLKEQGVIEIEALTYIRGRTLPNQIILLDECQNLSIHEVRTILTRAGEGSKVIMLGDVEQIDSPYLDSHNNGLSYVVDKFKNEPIAAHITLEKCERSELAEKAVELL